MVPPSLPASFKPGSPKPSFSNRPHPTLLSSVRIDYGRPQQVQETLLLRPDKRPSEVHLIKRPDGSGSSSQGHVHTEILVHHKPETINIRPQSAPQLPVHSHAHSVHQLPVRGQFPNTQNLMEQIPPRRAEVSTAAEVPHRYILPGKPDSGNEITLGTNWKSDKKPTRFAISNRPRPRPISRPTTKHPLDRHVVERPTSYPPIRKPIYSGSQRPPTKAQNVFTLPHRPPMTQSHQESTRVPPKLFTLQADHQNRPTYIYSDKSVSNIATLNAPTEQTDYVPTGAIEYHNPLHLNPISEENLHSHLPATKPQYPSEHISEKWQANAQLEQTLPDSDIGASEYVNYQNYHHKQGNKKQDTHQDRNATINTAYSQDTNHTVKSQTLYGTVVSVNTVMNRPLEVQQEPTAEIDRKPFLPQKPYNTDPYNTRPYDLPIIQGKPFGVYNGHMDLVTSYGYKRKEDKPIYEVVHGSHISDNKGVRPTSITKPQDGHATSNSLERDDTIDLKPPAVTPQFALEIDKPGRPYQRPIRPDSRPVLYHKPEIVTKPSIKLEIRPDYNIKHSGNVKPNIAETFINQTFDHKIKLNHDWNIDEITSDIVKSQENLSVGHTIQSSGNNVKIVENKNASRPIGNNRPGIIRLEHGTFTRVHPEYPHILTKPKPQVPKPVIVSSGSTGLETHNRPNIKFSMPVEISGEEMDSKTQTERPPSMLIIKNNLSHSKKSNETLNMAHQTNFASLESQDEIKIRPVNIKEINVPSRTMMPPPLNVRPNQLNKDKQEGLKPPPPPVSSDVFGLSPPPVDITTTHVPIEDRFSSITTSESGLKPPKYIPLKESTTIAPLLPSTNMVPPSPRPSLTRPYLVELLSQVKL